MDGVARMQLTLLDVTWRARAKDKDKGTDKGKENAVRPKAAKPGVAWGEGTGIDSRKGAAVARPTPTATAPSAAASSSSSAAATSCGTSSSAPPPSSRISAAAIMARMAEEEAAAAAAASKYSKYR
jgi:hypothetical protein